MTIEQMIIQAVLKAAVTGKDRNGNVKINPTVAKRNVGDLLGGATGGSVATRGAADRGANIDLSSVAGSLVPTAMNVAGDAAKLGFGIPAIRRSILGQALMSLHGPGRDALEEANNVIENSNKLRGAGMSSEGSALNLAGNIVSNRLNTEAERLEQAQRRHEAMDWAERHPEVSSGAYGWMGDIEKTGRKAMSNRGE